MNALRENSVDSGVALWPPEEFASRLSEPEDSVGKDVSVKVEPPPRGNRRKVFLVFGLALLTAAGLYGWHWWTAGRFLETTDDAYLQADKVTVAPRISGYVSEVLVSDNQPVKAGDVIARLDDREYQILLRQAQADVEKNKAQLKGVAAAIVQQMAQVEEARADVANTEAAQVFSSQEFTRYQALMQSGSGSVQRQQQAELEFRQRRAANNKARAALDSAMKQVDSLKALDASARASVEGAKAKLEQAQLNLSYTTITAPIDGVVGDRSLRIGQFVSPGTGLLTLVPMGRDIYLVANFKETQVGEMAEGQAASFTVDAFGSHEFKGRVASFAPGTGAQFALLPPENATGNFTKVAQRVPVRITLDPSEPLLGRLRPGLSVEVTVHTEGQTAAHGTPKHTSEALAQ